MEKIKLLLVLFTLWLSINLIAYVTLFESAYRISWILVGVITLFMIVTLMVFLSSSMGWTFASLLRINTHYIGKIVFQSFMGFIFLVLLLGGQIKFSEKFVYSPENDYIAEIQQVNLNGTKQWISTRTENADNPIILFLAGGPGGTQMSSTRMFLKSLEKEYTIINWEQPGVGKSYDAYQIDKMDVDAYIHDAHALTKYLKDIYHQEKIYLIGESWGSYLGILLSKAYPEDYYAFIGTGQMVDFTETEVYGYNLALEIATQNSDQRQIDALKKLGIPPIYGDVISFDMGTYLQYVHKHMQNHPDIQHRNWDTFNTLISPEYSVMDSVNFARGLLYTFSHIYQQLYGEDLRETHTSFEIPIYFLHGRYDFNAPGYLVEDYYELIDAPKKSLIWFENSGHNPWINETELFNETVKGLFTEHLN